jgi:hypothetical protein
MEELAGELARAEEQVSRLVIAREEVTRVLAEPAGTELPGDPAKEAGPVSPIGLVTVPPWQEGDDASVLPRSYQDLLEVAADAGRPLRAAQIAAAAGLGTDRAKVEALRSKLTRLAGRGWPAEEPGGLFTLPARTVAGEPVCPIYAGYFLSFPDPRAESVLTSQVV